MKFLKKIKYQLLILFFLLVVIAFVYSYTVEGLIYLVFQGDPDGVVSYFDDSPHMVLLFILFVVLEVVFISVIPSVILYTTGGLLFGTFYGSVIIWVGNIIGASICYFLSRTFLKDYFEKKIPDKKLKTFNKYVEKYGFYAIFLLRLNPFTSSDVFSYISGVTRLKFLPFIIGTGLGLIPLIVVTVFIGSDIIANNPYLTSLFLLGGLAYIILISYLFLKK